MNGKDLLIGLGDISHKYYEEAENDTIGSVPKYKTLRRPLMIAAILALTALLVGCAVVYALRLQDMSIGQETYTQTFDSQGKYLEEPVEKTRDILTLFGHSGDNIQKATAEWFAFLETYDPDGELMDNNPDHAEIPNQYEYTYGCYTQDMVNKVDEIAGKYDLKLLDEWLPFQRYQTDIFFEETGIGSFALPDSGAEISSISGMFYPPYNVDVDFELSLEGVRGKLWVTALYARKDYFPVDYPGGTDLSLYEQWDYTAPDGTSLLLALNKKGGGYIIAEPENAMLIYSIDGNFSSSAYPTAEEVMTKAELEVVADAFDYSIAPEILDRESVWEKLEASNEAHEAENVYVPETYGSFSEALKARYTIPNELAQYTFFDLTGDGVEDLLLDFNGDGSINEWFAMVNGEVYNDFGIDFYPCEGQVIERFYDDPERSGIHEQHIYEKSDNDTAWQDTDPETFGETITVLVMNKGEWSQMPHLHSLDEKEISEAEAKEIMAQYPRIQLDWKPIMDYPLSETQTVREYMEEKDVRVSGEELVEIYTEYLLRKDADGDLNNSYCRILDINGDGVDDLLIKGEGNAFIGNTDYYWMAMTYRYGQIVGLAADFYLCENNILEKVETRHSGGSGVEIDGHQFVRLDGLDEEILAFAAYNKSTGSWQVDWWTENSMTDEEANAILAKYPRIDQGMRPISELLG